MSPKLKDVWKDNTEQRGQKNPDHVRSNKRYKKQNLEGHAENHRGHRKAK